MDFNYNHSIPEQIKTQNDKEALWIRVAITSALRYRASVDFETFNTLIDQGVLYAMQANADYELPTPKIARYLQNAVNWSIDKYYRQEIKNVHYTYEAQSKKKRVGKAIKMSYSVKPFSAYDKDDLKFSDLMTNPTAGLTEEQYQKTVSLWKRVKAVVDSVVAKYPNEKQTSFREMFYAGRSSRDVGATIGRSQTTACNFYNEIMKEIRTQLNLLGLDKEWSLIQDNCI